jgi:branched-subunit amino acid aminotransferase/4-amino-4-deoxychorismate lyase
VTLPAWLNSGPVALDGAGSDAVRSRALALDAGLRSGWGVFETLRAHGTATLAADRHLERLTRGAERLGIPSDVALIRTALEVTLAAPRDVHEVVVRITLTAGPIAEDVWPALPLGRPTLAVTLHPAPLLPLEATDAVAVAARRWPADIKTTSYIASILAGAEAQRGGGSTAVLVDGEELVETAEGNLVALVDGALITPPADGRLLAGVTRSLVIEDARRLGIAVDEAPLRRQDIERADVVVVTSAVGGLRTLRSLDGILLAGSGSGTVLHALVPTLRAALETRRV